MTREGHAVSQHAVAFYAPDSEQAGMLARAQEIENLDRQQRAQSLIADEAHGASVRVEAAYTERRSGAGAGARRDAADAQTRAHELHVELLRLTQQAEASQLRGASSSTASWPRSTRSSRRWRSAAHRRRRASRNWTRNWPTRRSATANSTTR